eukprot:6644809-Alexandrium_andersonii.AAC.1
MWPREPRRSSWGSSCTAFRAERGGDDGGDDHDDGEGAADYGGDGDDDDGDDNAADYGGGD